MSVKLSKLTSLVGLAGPITGKKFASGVATTDSSGNLIASGLLFTPSLVVWYSDDGFVGVWSSDPSFSPNYYLGSARYTYGSYSTTDVYSQQKGNATVTNTGFTIPTGRTGVNYHWVAYE